MTQTNEKKSLLEKKTCHIQTYTIYNLYLYYIPYLLLVNSLGLVRVRVHEPLRHVIQLPDALAQRVQVPLEAVMLALQPLDRGQILAQLRVHQRLILLVDPVHGLVGVALEPLHLVRRHQLVLAVRGHLLQLGPLDVQDLDLVLDLLGRLGLIHLAQLLRDSVQLNDAGLVHLQVLLEVVESPRQQLHLSHY